MKVILTKFKNRWGESITLEYKDGYRFTVAERNMTERKLFHKLCGLDEGDHQFGQDIISEIDEILENRLNK